MYTQHVQKSPQIGHGHSRMWVFLSLLALALVAGLLLSLIPSLVQAPAQVAIAPPAAADPAAPSVLSYIQAHERMLARPVAADAATDGTLGYIQAHERLAARPAPDAATQGVLNYLRAHGAPIR